MSSLSVEFCADLSSIKRKSVQELSNEAIIPLLGQHYHGRGGFGYDDLKTAFRDCQWIEEDTEKDKQFGLPDGSEREKKALWYRKGISPAPDYHQRKAHVVNPSQNEMEEEVK
ncbi:hypothetical protein N0V91_004791 [Didymella pomorum]|uniref:Uncharacterized protein n=1 Tax=Didymella pomorum TaxID=749634 RepID=A0A9W8ZF74_9PLEO|nr:hypothetical protein N0V91_004791 [Didymella pomorum]